MASAPNREIKFKMYGLRTDGDDGKLVSAEALEKKLSAFVKALRKADAFINGAEVHQYMVNRLAIGSVEIGVIERQRSTRAAAENSAVTTLLDCAKAVSRSNFAAANKFGPVVNAIQGVCVGAGKEFSHIEIGPPKGLPIRADQFLLDQARAVLKERQASAGSLANFRGHARESLDGTIKEVDLRGDVQRVKLILTIGTKEIDCICKGLDIDEIRGALDQRAWVDGVAVYDGKTGLPARMEIEHIAPIKSGADLAKWRGSFEPMPAADWES